MNNLIKLNNTTDNDGNVDFIANRTKNNYINLGGINSKRIIDCVHAFLCHYGIWDENDTVVSTKKPLNFTPDPKYYNISFVLAFYNAACMCREARNSSEIKKKFIKEICLDNEDENESIPKKKSINYEVVC